MLKNAGVKFYGTYIQSTFGLKEIKPKGIFKYLSSTISWFVYQPQTLSHVEKSDNTSFHH